MRPTDKTAWRKLMTADAEAYGAARQMVLATTGFYCAYCESPLGVDMPVEHKTPKGGQNTGDINCFPDEATRYFNFVMACSACNSAKGAHPDKTEGAAWLARLFARPPTDYVHVLYGALGSMVWPDTLSAAMSDARPVPPDMRPYFTGRDETFRLFRYVLEPRTQLDLANAGYLRLSLADRNAPWAQTLQTKVWVLPDLAYINAQPDAVILLARVLNTLQRINLNFYNPNDLRASDRRVQGRTDAAATAVLALAELARVTTASLQTPVRLNSDPVWAMVRLIRDLARASGYWSTWMAVFADIVRGAALPWSNLTPVERTSLLRATLVQHVANEGVRPIFEFQPAPPPVLTGTDLTRIPL